MKKTLFITFIIVYGLTALVTLAGLIKIDGVSLGIDDKYLSKLVPTSIVQTVLAIVALFKLYFLDSRKTKFRFNIDESYDIHNVKNFNCEATLRNSEDGKEKILNCILYHDSNGLCCDLEIMNYKQTLSVIIKINDKKYQGSVWLETRTISLTKI